VIKFVSELRQVGGFSLDTPISSTNKNDRHDITEILLKVALVAPSFPLVNICWLFHFRGYQ
jgi:hypothetical protein